MLFEEEWFLTAAERDNPFTEIDHRHPAGAAWSTGNKVDFLIHGGTYFSVLLSCVSAMQRGDLLLFTDWRGDPDQRLAGADTEVSRVFGEAAKRGVIVKGLVWRSHLDRMRFSARENRHLGEEIEAAGGECLLDMRVRVGGSHHQKLVVLRHPGRPHLDVAFVGGIDLCHGRRDDERHLGDEQSQPTARVYGERPPWHDIQVAIKGPAVADVEMVFRERWDDPCPLTRSPLRRLLDRLRREDTSPGALPAQQADPPPTGRCAVQLLRTYPRRKPGYMFAPGGERSVARGYAKVLAQARSLIYVEDQFLWSREVAQTFADVLRTQRQLRIIAVVPHFPDQDGALSKPPNLIGRAAALDTLYAAAPDRVAIYGIENEKGTPVYVHAKVCVVDDVWAAVGSDNFNRRSWTYDSELSIAAIEGTPTRIPAQHRDSLARPASYAQRLRLALACEHLGRSPNDTADLLDAASAFKTFAAAAAELQAWYDKECDGPRPPARLRPAAIPTLSPWTRAWATPLYRVLYDPDGRRAAERRTGFF